MYCPSMCSKGAGWVGNMKVGGGVFILTHQDSWCLWSGPQFRTLCAWTASAQKGLSGFHGEGFGGGETVRLQHSCNGVLRTDLMTGVRVTWLQISLSRSPNMSSLWLGSSLALSSVAWRTPWKIRCCQWTHHLTPCRGPQVGEPH